MFRSNTYTVIALLFSIFLIFHYPYNNFFIESTPCLITRQCKNSTFIERIFHCVGLTADCATKPYESTETYKPTDDAIETYKTGYKIAYDVISAFKSLENYLKWIVHNSCDAHGTSCSGSLNRTVTTGIYTIEEKDIVKFCEAAFSHLGNGPKEILISAVQSVFYAKVPKWTHEYINVIHGKNNDRPITGGYFFIYAYGSGQERKVFISLATLSRQPAHSRYLLKSYYQGNEDHVENALKYIIYKDVKDKGLVK